MADELNLQHWDWWYNHDKGKWQFSDKNPTHCHTVEHNSHTNYPRIKHRPLQSEAND